jgi:hypothetical protein
MRTLEQQIQDQKMYIQQLESCLESEKKAHAQTYQLLQTMNNSLSLQLGIVSHMTHAMVGRRTS